MMLGMLMQVIRKLVLYKKLHCSKANQTIVSVCQLTSHSRRISSANKAVSSPAITYSTCELDSHADMIVAGKNCIILEYTGKECDVSPY